MRALHFKIIIIFFSVSNFSISSFTYYRLVHSPCTRIVRTVGTYCTPIGTYCTPMGTYCVPRGRVLYDPWARINIIRPLDVLYDSWASCTTRGHVFYDPWAHIVRPVGTYFTNRGHILYDPWARILRPMVFCTLWRFAS